jgi:hypothetical protein
MRCDNGRSACNTFVEVTPVQQEIVYVPAHPDPRTGHDGVRFETRLGSDGAPVGVAFTSLDKLVGALGPAQPWIAVPLPRLRLIFGAAGIAQIGLDPVPEADLPRWDLDAVQALSRAMEGQPHG